MLSLAVPFAHQPPADPQSLPSEMGEGFFSGQTPPAHAGVAVILEVLDRTRTQWVLVEREGGRLDFPGMAREHALEGASRSITDQCCLVEEGLPLSWSGLEFQPFQGSAAPGLTVYHAVLKVSDVAKLEARPVGAADACQVSLLGILAIQALADEGRLTEVAEGLWRAYWAVKPECC